MADHNECCDCDTIHCSDLHWEADVDDEGDEIRDEGSWYCCYCWGRMYQTACGFCQTHYPEYQDPYYPMPNKEQTTQPYSSTGYIRSSVTTTDMWSSHRNTEQSIRYNGVYSFD